MYKLASKLNWIYLVSRSPIQPNLLRARDDAITL